MKRRIWLILALAVLAVAAGAQDEEREVAPDQEPVVIEARVIEATPPAVRAEGDVLFQQGQKRLLADEVFYNYEDRTGLLTNATFTTCALDDPDYRITAREIRLTEEQRLKLTRVRIYLWNLRIVSLPKLSINVGPGAGRETLLPRPGFNSRDGFFLSARYPISDTDRTEASLVLRPTTKRGIQGGVVGGYAFRGSTRQISPYVQDFDSELRRGQSVLRPVIDEELCLFPEDQPQPAILAAFGAVLARERAFDVDDTGLLVTRFPEIGVRYVSPQVCIVREGERPRLGAQAQLRASWGRFKETPDGGYLNRLDTRGTASTTLATFRGSTALRATGLARYSNYENGESFRALGAALDVSRIYPGGSFASLRLITHATSGTTPFEFDDIDIERELEGAGRYVRGRFTYGLLLRYDLDERSLRDWEVSVAKRLDCLEPSISFRHRFSQISFGIRVLGL
ncbi:MAG: hypothetical protein HYX78_10380 [Armatimonadetes bacterium]|nr:hypothetical protein [Armatimonadota bacterium]